MKAVVSRADEYGKIATVGTLNRTVFKGTEKTILKRAKEYARGKSYEIEFFSEERFYGPPLKVLRFKQENLAVRKDERKTRYSRKQAGSVSPLFLIAVIGIAAAFLKNRQ